MPFKTGSLLMVGVTLLAVQFENGNFGVGQRPSFAEIVPRDATPKSDGWTDVMRQTSTSAAPIRLQLTSAPELGMVGLDEPCPTGMDEELGGAEAAALTTCAVHVDLAGPFATTRSPGRFQVWCQASDLSFHPANVIDRDVRIIGTAARDYRTVVVVEIAASDPAGLPTFAALRRDPSARGGLGDGCPTMQDLGTGLDVDHEIVDPYRPSPDGVPLLLSVGGVAVRPSSVGVELVRLTTEVPVESPESAAGGFGGGE